MSTAPLLSSSRSRRHRDAATKRRLYNQMCLLKQPNDINQKDNPVAYNIDRVEVLVQLVQQLALDMSIMATCLTQSYYQYSYCHEAAWMPYHHGDTSCNSADNVDIKQTDEENKDQLILSPFAEHGSDEGLELNFKLWVPGNSKQFVRPHTQTEHELREEAALCIQRFQRCHHSRQPQAESSINSSIPEACEQCGAAFASSQLCEDYVDRCDKCGSFCHTECLHSAVDTKGDWNLCTACMSLQSPAQVSAIGSAASITEDTEAISHSHVAEQPCVSLDVTLDYIVRFLEGDHAKSRSISQGTRSAVLEHVKDAIAWKAEDHTNEEIQQKAQELNAMMSKVVRNL